MTKPRVSHFSAFVMLAVTINLLSSLSLSDLKSSYNYMHSMGTKHLLDGWCVSSFINGMNLHDMFCHVHVPSQKAHH